MEQYLDRVDVEWAFEVKMQCAIRSMDYHNTKPWVVYVTINNVVQLWDYERKICLKSLHSSTIDTIDHSKSMEIRSVRFLDADTLNWMFPPGGASETTSSYSSNRQSEHRFPHQWIIICAESKIFFFDYVSDTSRVITSNELDSKYVRVVQAIDAQYLAIGCSDGSIKIFDITTWTITKTMKEQHSKAVNFIIPYKQDQSSRPRLIVSSLDGYISCWNVDSNVDLPSFKLHFMNKQGKTSNDDENVISMSYDPVSLTLVTVTEGYVTVWNMMNGTELKRQKNGKDRELVKEAAFFHHPSMGSDCVVFHGGRMELGTFQTAVRQGSGSSSNDGKGEKISVNTFFDMKQNQEIDKQTKILTLAVHQMKPFRVFLGTTSGLYVLNFDKHKTTPICFNHFFSTSHSVDQMKDFINVDGSLKKMDSALLQRLRMHENTSQLNQTTLNFIYLHFLGNSLSCTLFELQAAANKEISFIEVRSRLHSMKMHFKWEDSEIKASTSGKYVSIFCRANGYFEVFRVNNSHFMEKNRIDLLSDGSEDSLHFLSQLESMYTGCCTKLVWHSYLDEFATLMPVNKKGDFIRVDEKVITQSTGGLFSSKTIQTYSTVYSDTVTKVIFALFEITNDNSKPAVRLAFKKDSFLNPTKLFSGEFYGIVDLMSEKDMADIIGKQDNRAKEQMQMLKLNKCEFFEIARANNANSNQAVYISVGKPIIEPKELYWNLDHTLCIASYVDFVILLKARDGALRHAQTINTTITHGQFLEDLFFYVTDDSIGLLVCDFEKDVIDLKLATLDKVVSMSDLMDLTGITTFGGDDSLNFTDSIYPDLQRRPAGVLEIMIVYDFKLVLINEKREIATIDLSHPFIRFCMFLQHGELDRCSDIAASFDRNLHYIFAKMFLYRNAPSQAMNLRGISLLDRAILHFDAQKFPEMLFSEKVLDEMMVERRYSNPEKSAILTYLAVKCHQDHKKDQVDLLIRYGIDSHIFNDDTNIILLTENEKLIEDFCAKYCGNLIVPLHLKKEGAQKLKNKKEIVENWTSQMSYVLGNLLSQNKTSPFK